MMKFKDTIRHKTRRSNGHSLEAIIADLNVTLRGWYEYFKQSWKTVFPELDGYIRQRLLRGAWAVQLRDRLFS